MQQRQRKDRDTNGARNYLGLRSLFRDLSSRYDDRTADLRDINDKLRLSWEHTSSALEKRFYHPEINLETRREMLRITREMCSKANEAKTAMTGFRQKVDALPNIDRVLTRSKRNLVKELGGLVAFTEDVASFEGRLTGVLEEATNE